MIFHWNLNDCKTPPVANTLLIILAVLNNKVVCKVYISPSISKSSSPFDNPLVTVPKAPIPIGIIITFMFHSFSISFILLLFTLLEVFTSVLADGLSLYF